MKIVLHGYGEYAVLYRHLIDRAHKDAPELQWAVILPTSHFKDRFQAVLPDDHILCLEDARARYRPAAADPAELAGYFGNINADIEAEKHTFKFRPAAEQLSRALETYRLYKDFFSRVQPTLVLFSHVEGYESKMLIAVAREFGVEVAVPTDCRSIGGTYFSPDDLETVPQPRPVTPELLAKAREFLAAFRERNLPAGRVPFNISPDDRPLSNFRKPLPIRTMNFVRRLLRDPALFEFINLRVSVQNNLPLVRDTIWRLRAARNARQFDIGSLDALPAKFIYYPLQYSPESSINTPAPFYVDQLRAIDAIRFAMPSDHLLVVKEHPACITVRAVDFMPALRRKAGVTVAHYRLDSLEIIRRAAATIAVTGTATLEAFLLGRPSLVLGHSLVTEYLGGVCSIADLPERLRKVLGRTLPEESIVRAVAELMSVSHDFLLWPPGRAGEPALRNENIRRFLKALVTHLNRNRATAAA